MSAVSTLKTWTKYQAYLKQWMDDWTAESRDTPDCPPDTFGGEVRKRAWSKYWSIMSRIPWRKKLLEGS
jgi:hypothetical protein